MAVVTPTDRPKSVRNRCVIEVLVAFLCCQMVVEFSVGIVAFGIGLSQISVFFYLYMYNPCTRNICDSFWSLWSYEFTGK